MKINGKTVNIVIPVNGNANNNLCKFVSNKSLMSSLIVFKRTPAFFKHCALYALFTEAHHVIMKNAVTPIVITPYNKIKTELCPAS